MLPQTLALQNKKNDVREKQKNKARREAVYEKK